MSIRHFLANIWITNCVYSYCGYFFAIEKEVHACMLYMKTFMHDIWGAPCEELGLESQCPIPIQHATASSMHIDLRTYKSQT